VCEIHVPKRFMRGDILCFQCRVCGFQSGVLLGAAS
jgi:hypothetical protein